VADEVNLALFVARAWVGIVMFVHGWRHLKSLQSGPGMANWLESIGLRNGPLQAQLLTWSELAVGPVLLLGFLTPLAYGAAASLMLVAFWTNHKDKGFFITARPTEGWEYVMTVGVLALALGVLSPGEWSLDDAFGFSFPFKPGTSLLLVLLAGIGGTIGYLATFWRPPVKSAD
jgi:putative oxidoreductase